MRPVLKKSLYRVILTKKGTNNFEAFVPEFKDVKEVGYSIDNVLDKIRISLNKEVNKYILESEDLPEKKSIFEIKDFIKENNFVTGIEIKYNKYM